MAKSQVAVRIPPYLLQQLNNYVEQTGTCKTDVIVSAIAQDLGCTSAVPLSQRIAELEAKVELQALVKK